MADPLHILKHEHRVIEQGLRALDGVCLKLAWGEQVPTEVLSQLLDFARTFAGRYHHGKEEAYLLPALKKEGLLDDEEAIAVIVREHQVERQLLAELGRAFDAHRDGGPDSAKLVIETARRYVDLLIGHMQKEDNILFRIAEDMLDETARDSLSKAFNQAMDESGTRTYERYEELAAELEKAWAI